MNAKIPVTLIGLGYWGPKILRNILASADFQIHSLVDSNSDALTAYSSAVGSGRCYELIDQVPLEEVEAVFIATPPQTHSGIGHFFLSHGKHVWIEKPLGTSSREADALVTSAASAGVVLWADLPYLFHGAVKRMAHDFRDGRFGNPTYVITNRSNFGMYHQTVDVVRDLLVHDYAIVDAILGGGPSAVSASLFKELRPGCASLAFVSTMWDSGVILHSTGNQLAASKIRLVEVRGDRASALFDDNSSTTKLTYTNSTLPDHLSATPWSVGEQHALNEQTVIDIHSAEPLSESIAAFAATIRDERRPVIPESTRIALGAHRWAEAAFESAAGGSGWVPVWQEAVTNP